MHRSFAISFAALLSLSALAFAADAPALKVTVGDIKDGGRIPERFAYCVASASQHTKPGPNISPRISWSGAPAGTKSFALIMVDNDVPAEFDDANKEGKTLPATMKRRDFYHWVLVDIPSHLAELAEGQDSKGITDGGKDPGDQGYGITGVNDYASFGKGKGGGYDGPCPPWNDELLHHYHFHVYALDVETLKLKGKFTGEQAMKALRPHVLAKGEVTGTYTQNPKVKN